MKAVRTRFAPSPTGFQHVGGFRTAMYAWLLAKKHHGQFILRIEDTDQARKVEGAVKYLEESLKWLGIDYDEGPYFQSERTKPYQEAAERLIAEGKAYRCDCSAERLEQERNEQMARREKPGYSGYCRTRNVSKDAPHVVRLRLPDKIKVSIDDAVRGKIVWEDPPLRDPVLIKSDGFATYHLASVVDDHDMRISHILRGEEWIPTTPIHVLLYEAFGWEQPVFVHLSHILGPDGKKLSKRHGAVPVNEYKDQGIIAEALLNYVVLIGWSPGEGDEQEVFTREELIQKFSLEGLNSSGGVFDNAKLKWMNGVYFRSLSVEDFNKIALPVIKSKTDKLDMTAWNLLAPHVQERMHTLDELVPMTEFLWQEPLKREIEEIKDPEQAQIVFKAALDSLKKLEDFSVEKVQTALKSLVDELGLKIGQVLLPLRIAVTGKKATPPLFESIVALGKEKTLEFLSEMLDESTS